MIILTIVLTCVSGSAGKKLAESIIKEKLAGKVILFFFINYKTENVKLYINDLVEVSDNGNVMIIVFVCHFVKGNTREVLPEFLFGT